MKRTADTKGLRRQSPKSALAAVTYAVGDIHGYSTLLQELLDKILAHRKTISGSAKIVFLGDYVDRGPDTPGVLKTILSRWLRDAFDEVICLKGNHELMIREDLDRCDSEKHRDLDPKFLKIRCAEITKRFGLTPASLERFLQSLPLYHDDGIRLFTHAGIPFGRAIEAVPEEELLWYRGPVQDSSGRLVVHGHTCTFKKPLVTPHAVNIDTGVYVTGQLTCAVFKGRSRRATFLSTPVLEPYVDRSISFWF